MANTAQSKKRARQADARYAVNKARRSRIRTFLRKVEEAIASGNADAAAAALKAACTRTPWPGKCRASRRA
jgi:small subunit ribosomal protein S20